MKFWMLRQPTYCEFGLLDASTPCPPQVLHQSETARDKACDKKTIEENWRPSGYVTIFDEYGFHGEI
jgi:hypothetical protein